MREYLAFNNQLTSVKVFQIDPHTLMSSFTAGVENKTSKQIALIRFNFRGKQVKTVRNLLKDYRIYACVKIKGSKYKY